MGAVQHLLVASSQFPRNSSRRLTFEELAKTTGAVVTEVQSQENDLLSCKRSPRSHPLTPPR
eukprot:10183149-Karenia_brevis.AAC.1